MVRECFYGEETCPPLSATNNPSFFIFTITSPFLRRAAELCLLKRHQCFGLMVTLQRTQICTRPTLPEETHIFHLPLRFSLQITVKSSLILREIWWDCNQASVNFSMPGRGRQGENLTWQIHLPNSQWNFFPPEKVSSSFYSSWAYYF